MLRTTVIREYRRQDLDAMFLLDCVCFAPVYRFSKRALRSFAEARDAVSLVAVQDSAVLAGFIIVQVERPAAGRYGYVATLDVAPEWRRSGVASQLMAEAERTVIERGLAAMALHVAAGNESAARFYERVGYQRVGVQKDFYATGLDAFVYRKLLGE